MSAPVRYETRNPIDQRWPLEDECQCWDFRPLEMPMKHICADFNRDGMLVYATRPIWTASSRKMSGAAPAPTPRGAHEGL